MKASIECLTVQARGAGAGIDGELQKRIASVCGVPAQDILGYKILKRSIDARQKPDIKILYKLVAEIREGARPSLKIEAPQAEEPVWTPPRKAASPGLKNPIVVGSGPGGLFAALALAEAGTCPIVLERGYDVARRKADIDAFFKTRRLDTESNLLFGEGGAGTWSDGKLFTRIRDPRLRYVLEGFVNAGASEAILYYSHPHIGSDKLPGVVAGIRKRIEALGGTFQWGTCVERPLIENGVCKGVRTTKGENLEAPATIIACGHSARELLLSMADAGVAHSLKGFQIGCRVEHPQEFINYIQYGDADAPASLGAAEYCFSSKPTPDRRVQGATTFCMCPGGEIIPCVSEEGQLSTNGMSQASRSGRFANAAVVTALDQGFRDAKDAFRFLKGIEEAAFKAGGSDYSAPAQTVGGFIRNAVQAPQESSYALGLKAANINFLLPRDIADAIARALNHFDKMAPGFVKYGSLIGVETRVSSPLRFERKPGLMESGVNRLHVVGEGAGMAGGIVSAAVDGVKAAEELLLNANL